VRLKYLAGYPLPGVSDAQAEVIVTRTFEWKERRVQSIRILLRADKVIA
jgi:hypothetical protein